MPPPKASAAAVFAEALAVQWRVSGALLLREIQNRWGRRNLGFAWLFAEPLVFALPVLIMWSYLRGSHDNGLPMMAFAWSGYLPILIFRHLVGSSLNVVRNNSALLYHRLVTPLDLFTAAAGLEALGNLAAVIFSFTILYGCGQLNWPADPWLMIIGFLYSVWWAVSVALVVSALSERSEIVIHIWSPMAYMYMPLSGFMFLADWLPAPLRRIALTVDPPLHLFEMIRSGLFGARIHTYYDLPYVTYIIATMTLIGLWLMRHVRNHLEVL